MKKILSIKVQNSEFFIDGFEIELSEKLNCIMGGRGTGKSTILHFIKSCIENDAEENKDTYNILKNNLGNGLVRIFIQDENGNKYKIEKSFGEEPQYYLLPNEKHISAENIRNDLACDIFPAQKIEEIGRNSEARLELIDRMLIGEV